MTRNICYSQHDPALVFIMYLCVRTSAILCYLHGKWLSRGQETKALGKRLSLGKQELMR